MSKYIDAEKLIADIEKLSDCRERPEFNQMEEDAYSRAIDEIKNLIASLQQEAEKERIKEQKELNKIAIQYRDDVIAHIEEKRVLPSFKGQLLHDFKNEVNTMRQILGVVNWGNVQNALFEKFALVFATWGGYHFHPKDTETEDSLQQEQPEVDLDFEKEMNKLISLEYVNQPDDEWEMCIARHFYELGLNARKEE